MPTVRTLVREATANRPYARAVATGTPGYTSPPCLRPVCAAVLLGCEPRLELCHRFREISPQIVR